MRASGAAEPTHAVRKASGIETDLGIAEPLADASENLIRINLQLVYQRNGMASRH